MTAPTLSALFAALEATWPPARVIDTPVFRLRDGQGGGQRVSSAVATGPASEGEIADTEIAMRDMGQRPLFMIRPDDAALDQTLAKHGYTVSDPTLLYQIEAQRIARPMRSGQIFASWPPFAVQREIWDAGGVGAARLAVMDRACSPKTSLLSRIKDTPATTVFVAVSNGVAMLHALEVAPDARRQGQGEATVRAAAEWAKSLGAEWLALAVTEANEAANALYQKLGMERVGHYHYRRAPEAAS